MMAANTGLNWRFSASPVHYTPNRSCCTAAPRRTPSRIKWPP